MITEIGFGSLFVALIISIFGIYAAIVGARKANRNWILTAKRAMVVVFPLISISILSLMILLLRNHFEVVYVYQVSSLNTPTYLKLTALWASQAGSLLFWSWLLAGFGFIVSLQKWNRDQGLLPWVIVVILATLAFFLLVNIFVENPFTRYWQNQAGIITSLGRPAGALAVFPWDGEGLDPYLRHPGMIIHPPLQYLGLIGFIIPFSFAIASLISGRSDDRWIQISRPWVLWSWLMLSLGLVLGAWWSYDVLGWGGYWGWDPVELAGLMPWLSSTAYLHAVLIYEKRGAFKQLSLVLIILTYLLVIFGTFITRSGILSSVHSFAQSDIGPILLIFLSILIIATVMVVGSRWDSLKSNFSLKSYFSKESLIVISVILFIGLLVTSFWGVMFPILSELVTGQKITVGPPFYERVFAPVSGGLLLIMVICPLVVWSYASFKHLGRLLWKPFTISLLGIILPLWGGLSRWEAVLAFWLVAFILAVNGFEFYRRFQSRRRDPSERFWTAFGGVFQRNQRSLSSMIIHIAVVLMALGIIGIEFFQAETQGTIAQGEKIQLDRYEMVYQQLDIYNTPDARYVARAEVEITKDGEVVGALYPRRDYFYESKRSVTIPGVRSTLLDDFYVVLVDWRDVSAEGATFKVYHNPLVKWLWIGAGIFILGVVGSTWPEKRSIYSKEVSGS